MHFPQHEDDGDDLRGEVRGDEAGDDGCDDELGFMSGTSSSPTLRLSSLPPAVDESRASE